METGTWLRPYWEDHYECITVYADDLLIVSKDPKSIIDVLTNKHSFKLKGTGPISYHLGYDFGRDDYGTLYFGPKKNVETMVDFYYNMFGTKPKLYFTSTLEKSDHPELEASEYIDSDGIQKHESIIGAIQWAVYLGIIGFNAAVMTLASFRDEPTQGHFDRCKIVVSYLDKFKWTTISDRTEEPDLSSIPTTPYDWEKTVCGKVKELASQDAPAPLGKHVVTISYHDTNLFHNVITR